MIRYLEKVRTLTSSFKAFLIRQIPRSENKKADALSKIAFTSFAHLSKQVLVKELKEKSISEVEILAVVEEEGDTWMTPIFEYLKDETLPADLKKARAGIDIAGPFQEGPGKVNFLIVAMDYFTKWIEAKPVATITGNQIKKFVWDNIVCRFELPGEIISDNEKHFRDNPFKQCLGEGIKARLGARNNKWMEEFSHVLWAHRTMIRSSNEDTQFSLTYETEAVIPAEIGMPTPRTAEVDLAQNNEAWKSTSTFWKNEGSKHEAKSKARMEKKGYKGQKKAKTVKNRQGTEKDKSRVKTGNQSKAGSVRYSFA
ncbi:reverse transcriptase domain-containing protein [Tanacetum coccineum]